MTRFLVLSAAVLGSAAVAADDASSVGIKKKSAPTPPAVSAASLPLTGLAPAPVTPGLCLVHYPVGTRSAECQALCDQGLGYFYSYVWMEAARCFETAARHDPDCAFAWLGLHRAIDKWGKGTKPNTDPFLAVAGAAWQPKVPDRFTKAAKDSTLETARTLMPTAPHRVQLLIRSKLEEKGMVPGVTPEDRKKKAQATLDELLTLHDDDEEGWYARAQIAEGPNAAVPVYKALLRLNPVHPGANHELVHFYEGFKRPGLGWPYAEGYMKSSPGLPHAFHMQAHLAMRLGKWGSTADWSRKAYEMEKAYHAALKVKPEDDHQFRHHAETLTRGLVHDGRFAEAKQVKADAAGYKFEFRPEWFRMAVAEHDWAEAQKIVDQYRKTDKATAAYYAAVLALEQDDPDRAQAEVDTLRQTQQVKKGPAAAKQQELRLWEVQGRLLCRTGQADGGLKLLQRAVDKVKDDFAAHSWGGGGYFMEAWGVGALEGGRAAAAEEAFQEALAHDPGSVRGALGLAALCDRLGRADEAERYLKLAHRCWGKASASDFDRLHADFARRAANVPATTTAGGE